MTQFSGETMGTTFMVKVATELPSVEQSALAEQISSALDQVDRAMSTYRDDSELMRFNKVPAGEPFTFESATFDVLLRALDVSHATDGAFDIAVGPLVSAWGFGAGGGEPEELRAPEEAVLAALLERIDARQQLLLDTAEGSVTKARGDVFVDLSGIAKGFAVDQVAEVLVASNIASFLVEVGGEMRARGTRPDGDSWRVGIERPTEARGHAQRILRLDDRAIATSGDYRNYRELDGTRISHIIDPRVGKPIGHRLASASVVADDCATADAWATALLVLGEEEGLTRANENGIAALMLVREQGGGFSERASSAFRERFPRANQTAISTTAQGDGP